LQALLAVWGQSIDIRTRDGVEDSFELNGKRRGIHSLVADDDIVVTFGTATLPYTVATRIEDTDGEVWSDGTKLETFGIVYTVTTSIGSTRTHSRTLRAVDRTNPVVTLVYSRHTGPIADWNTIVYEWIRADKGLLTVSGTGPMDVTVGDSVVLRGLGVSEPIEGSHGLDDPPNEVAGIVEVRSRQGTGTVGIRYTAGINRYQSRSGALQWAII
jgi:hypothetical protein